MSDPPKSGHHFWPPAVLGQLAGAGLVVGLLQLHAGSAWQGLFAFPEPFGFAVAGAWVASAGVAAWGLVRRTGSQPLWPVLAGLGPLAVAFLLSGMTDANRQMLSEGGCTLWLSLSASAERLRIVGLLGAAAVWWGCLPGLLLLPGPDRTGRPVWVLPLMGALVAGAGIWALVDPLVPATSPVGGPAVRGLWPVALGLPAAWLGSIGLSRSANGTEAERGLGLAAAAWLGLLAATFAAWLLHRADALERLLASGSGPMAWPDWFAAGRSLAAACWPLVITAAVALAVGAWLVGARLSPGGRRRGLGLLVVLAVLAVLAFAHERTFSSRFESRCAADQGLGDCALERRVLGVCLSRARPD